MNDILSQLQIVFNGTLQAGNIKTMEDARILIHLYRNIENALSENVQLKKELQRFRSKADINDES